MIKREKGKHNSDVTVDDFYKYYASKVHNPVSRKVFGDFYRDMFKEFSQIKKYSFCKIDICKHVSK